MCVFVFSPHHHHTHTPQSYPTLPPYLRQIGLAEGAQTFIHRLTYSHKYTHQHKHARTIANKRIQARRLGVAGKVEESGPLSRGKPDSNAVSQEVLDRRHTRPVNPLGHVCYSGRSSVNNLTTWQPPVTVRLMRSPKFAASPPHTHKLSYDEY